MEFLPAVIEAEYRGDYLIKLTFNDGVGETVDFAQWLDGPVFEPLQGCRLFPEVLPRGRDGRVAQWSRHRTRDIARVGEVASGGLSGC